jgi:hypothetical protein
MPFQMSQERGASQMKRESHVLGVAMQVIPPTSAPPPDEEQLLSLMHTLVLDARHPVALEIAGTARRRCLVVRATTENALEQVRRQLLACYPQARCVPLADDPLRLHTEETVSGCELRLGTASFVPLRTWKGRGKPTAFSPVEGLLAGLDGLPEGVRAVCQLTLVPAAPTWSHASQQTALASTVEAAQRERQFPQQRGAPSVTTLLLGGCLLVGLLAFPRTEQHIPAWIGPALSHLSRGEIQAVPLQQLLPLAGGLITLFALLIGGRLLVGWLRRHLFAQALYARRRIEEHTAQMAYRVRLRLYVLGPTHALQWMPAHLRCFAHRRWLWHLAARPARGRMAHAIRFAGLLLRLLGRQGQRFLGRWGKQLWQGWREQRAEQAQHRAVLARLVACYRQYHLAAGNYFVPHVLVARRTHSRWWQGVRHSRQLLNVEELAHLWHLPGGLHLVELAQVEHRQARSLLVSASLTSASPTSPVVGVSEHAGHQVPVRLPADLFHAHLFLAGKTGEGKSTALVHLGMAGMQRGGMVVIDPHGDLVEHLLRVVPQARQEEVVLVDLADTEAVVGLNPLDVTLGRGRDKTVTDLLRTFAHIGSASWGSRMESVFEYALRTLYEANAVLCQHDPVLGPAQQYTLLDVLPLLTDESFCHQLLEPLATVDPYLVRWWYLYYDPLSPYMQRDRSDPVLSKVARFESYVARRIVGQSQSTLDLARCIREEQIVLVSLAKGVVGEEIAHLLGATMLSLVHLALEEQAGQAQAERKRLLILVDEFQLLTGVDWAALAELRKYGASFALATQSLHVLKERHATLLSLVLASVKQWIIFHLSAQDARLLAEDLDVEPEDLVHMERYTSYVKLLSGEVRHPTFSLRWLLPPPGSVERATLIREQARRRETRPAHLIDVHLAEAVIRAQAASPAPTEEGMPHASGHAQTTGTPIGKDAGQGPQHAFTSKYRGRRSQQKRAGRAQEIPKPMNWQETVGAQGGDIHPQTVKQQETEPQAGREHEEGEREEEAVRFLEEAEALHRQEEHEHDEPEQEA